MLSDKAQFSLEQAEGVTEASSEAFQDRVATKDDLAVLEQRFTIEICGVLVVAVGVVATLPKVIP
jgi:hypothetical protein